MSDDDDVEEEVSAAVSDFAAKSGVLSDGDDASFCRSSFVIL